MRLEREKLEHEFLQPCAARAQNSRGRLVPEPECEMRTCFQRDIDRIIHSKSFRRLMHKTQVFLQPEGDHYRTRLTHTLEVSRIARSIARALLLNEDLTEAIALGHDLGHTPFGHAGERALAELMKGEGGFTHYEQSLRVVDILEKEGHGLNLTWEVRNGIVRHTTPPPAATLEGRVVKLADRIAYINADMDDAVRAGLLREEDIPEEITCALGDVYSQRINTLIRDAVQASTGKEDILLSPEIAFVLDSFHDFMFQAVYKNPAAKSEEVKVSGIIEGLYSYYVRRPELLPGEYSMVAEKDGIPRAVCDYISGMTDKYCLDTYSLLYIPAGWQVK